MFLSHWFELSGIDQVMAPVNPDNPPTPAGVADNGDDEEESRIWSIVAPRSKDSGAAPAKRRALPSPPAFVKCHHCGYMTPVDGSATTSANATETPSNPATPVIGRAPHHPRTPAKTPAGYLADDDEAKFRTDAILDEQSHFSAQVLRAVEDTALTSSALPHSTPTPPARGLVTI